MTYRGPDTLWHEHLRDERLAVRDRKPIQALNDYREHLHRMCGRDIPNFDPFDGGVCARLLILLETPGPSIVGCERRFVSIDNPTGTAKNLRDALLTAGISRRDIIAWNAVPWIRSTRKLIGKAERDDGVKALTALLPILCGVKVAILAGAVAHAAKQVIEQAGIQTILAPHPSPVRINTSPTVRESFHSAFVAAGKVLENDNNSERRMR
ncbi:uracil-DNA glycosylase [Rhizobium rhizogenes]|uniref:uracil-DNA glycosylase n=1 Tax=Rhizobium rhizogenes TaxID=359 RepID=UPI0022B664BA|nr:uracil-DNA glycosylase [Rhizobium rhizogenes]MCZ7448289.1 uracil-DNA glycosylase [Rhizobium rhizogenes]MCZ7465722.1 uracil-DNA glycosylase [Rhizobium rhizogenes]